jgi:hypothetical protein
MMVRWRRASAGGPVRCRNLASWGRRRGSDRVTSSRRLASAPTGILPTACRLLHQGPAGLGGGPTDARPGAGSWRPSVGGHDGQGPAIRQPDAGRSDDPTPSSHPDSRVRGDLSIEPRRPFLAIEATDGAAHSVDGVEISGPASDHAGRPAVEEPCHHRLLAPLLHATLVPASAHRGMSARPRANRHRRERRALNTELRVEAPSDHGPIRCRPRRGLWCWTPSSTARHAGHRQCAGG